MKNPTLRRVADWFYRHDIRGKFRRLVSAKDAAK